MQDPIRKSHVFMFKATYQCLYRKVKHYMDLRGSLKRKVATEVT